MTNLKILASRMCFNVYVTRITIFMPWKCNDDRLKLDHLHPEQFSDGNKFVWRNIKQTIKIQQVVTLKWFLCKVMKPDSNHISHV